LELHASAAALRTFQPHGLYRMAQIDQEQTVSFCFAISILRQLRSIGSSFKKRAIEIKLTIENSNYQTILSEVPSYD
jgi:hypothetical protein